MRIRLMARRRLYVQKSGPKTESAVVDSRNKFMYYSQVDRKKKKGNATDCCLLVAIETTEMTGQQLLTLNHKKGSILVSGDF